MEPTLRLFLLGQPRIEWLGVPLRVKRRKTLHLLAYLALNTGEHLREKLAVLLWQSVGNEAARLSLRVALSELRKLLGAEAFCGGHERIGLNPSLTRWVDVQDFETFAHSKNADDWQRALNLYQGDFLPDADDDWACRLRAACVQTRLTVLLHLAARARSAANYLQAIAFAQMVLQHEPANEMAHQQVMVCYETLGEIQLALVQYAACENALRLQGDTPSAQTEAIARRLKSASARGAAVVYPTNLAQPLSSFIGREAELEQIENLLMPLQRSAQPARLVTLLGSGGSGKTRLAVQAAWELIDQYPQGIWWVDLSPLTRAEDVLPQMTAVLGVRRLSGLTLEEAVCAHLQARRCLLILDNCEHLLAVCAQVTARILAQCAQVQILTTSREPLRVAGEQVFGVQPLNLPALEVATLRRCLRRVGSRGGATN
ncbi:MAG: hypothetical protein OHK0052_05390 [Anaerolineales bacterium]